MKTVLNHAELIARVLREITQHEDCAGVTSIDIEATGDAPPLPTWIVTGVEKHGESAAVNAKCYALITGLQLKYDLE